MEKDKIIKDGIRSRIIILIIILAIIVIVGIVFINLIKKYISQDESENNSVVSNSLNIDNNNSNNNAQSTIVNVLQVKSLNEINCELSNDTITEYANVKKDYLKTDNGKVEINISSFDTKIEKTNVYNEKTVTDGVILFYNSNRKKLYRKI